MAARFQHDCDSCVYLTSYQVEGEEQARDFYFCPRCDGGSLIARYGNEGPEYSSAPWNIAEELVLRYHAHNKVHYFEKALALCIGLVQRSIYDRYRSLELKLETTPSPNKEKLSFVRERLWQIQNHYTGY